MKVNVLFYIWIFLLLTACGSNQPSQTLSEQPTCSGFAKNSLNQQMYWGSSFPIKLYIDPSVPQQFRGAIQSAANTWNDIFNIKIFDIAGTLSKTTAPKEDGKNVISWMSSWSDSSKLQASTLLHWNHSSIYEADILINAQDFQYSDEPNKTELDLESIVLHEMGHILGLGHVQDSTSIMQAELERGVKRRTLSQNDIDHIQCKYK